MERNLQTTPERRAELIACHTSAHTIMMTLSANCLVDAMSGKMPQSFVWIVRHKRT